MGECMSKQKQSQSKQQPQPILSIQKKPGTQPLLPHSSQSIPTQTQIQNINNQFLNRRQVKFWIRKINQICRNVGKNQINGGGMKKISNGETKGYYQGDVGKMGVGGNGVGDGVRRGNRVEEEFGEVEGQGFVSQENVAQFFKDSQLSNVTIKKMYNMFKGNQQSLSKQQFLNQLKRLASLSDQELASYIYSLYFNSSSSAISSSLSSIPTSSQKILSTTSIPLPSPIDLSTFESDLKPYIKNSNNQDESLNIRISRSQKQRPYEQVIKQLTNLLKKRKSILPEQNKAIIKWLKKNILFRKFKLQLLESNAKNGQIYAYREFLFDFGNKSSWIGQGQGESQVVVVNWRWCENMLKYFQEKYDVQGMNKIKRRPTLEIDSPIPNYISVRQRKRSSQFQPQTPLLPNSSTPIQAQYRSSIQSPLLTDSAVQQGFYKKLASQSLNIRQILSRQQIKIIQKTQGSSYQFKNHPGQINNYNLIGQFQWELKKNIRKNVDYITIKKDTYDRLEDVFGGNGPVFLRRVVQGYMEIRPYFVYIGQFVFDENNYFPVLKNMQIIKLAPSQLFATLNQKFKQKIPINYQTYHRNIGQQWRPLPAFTSTTSFQSSTQLSHKVMDIFTQTSFLLIFEKSQQVYFRRHYISEFRQPKLGDKFISTTYKILEDKQDKVGVSRDYVRVCICNDQSKDYVEFVVLNWSHHLKRKISIHQFKKYFRRDEGGVQMLNSVQKRKRAGIQNLGNTCYMNAVLQALFSTLNPFQLQNLQGQLSLQLNHIQKTLTQSKRNVFPADFKTAFDKKYPYFQGQQQHDSHQFAISLFTQLQHENQKNSKNLLLLQNLLKIENTVKYKCLACKSIVKQEPVSEYIMTMFIKDYKTKQVKIDYVVGNVEIKTVCFKIQEDCKVRDWKLAFERACGAKEYYFCEIQKAGVRRTFNSSDNIDDMPYEELNISSDMVVAAYETKVFDEKPAIEPTFDDYKTYKSSNGNYYIVRLNNQNTNKYGLRQQTQLQQQPNPISKKVNVIIKNGSQMQQKTVKQDQLLSFPSSIPLKPSIIQLINHDDMYNEDIGKPFIFKIPPHYPISSIRQALQACIGKKGYIIRVTRPNQHSKCDICKKYNHMSSSCFLKKENLAPVGWIQGLLDVVVVWQDVSEYYRLIKRSKFVSNDTQKQRQDQYDKFSNSFHNQLNNEIIQDLNCDICHRKNVSFQKSVHIKKWPQILIIHLSRFKLTTNQLSKIHTKWLLEQELKIQEKDKNKDKDKEGVDREKGKEEEKEGLGRDKDKDKGARKYILKGVICHIGNNADSGHFVTFSDGVCYDDEEVTEAGFAKVKPEEVYMMFYRRVDI